MNRIQTTSSTRSTAGFIMQMWYLLTGYSSYLMRNKNCHLNLLGLRYELLNQYFTFLIMPSKTYGFYTSNLTVLFKSIIQKYIPQNKLSYHILVYIQIHFMAILLINFLDIGKQKKAWGDVRHDIRYRRRKTEKAPQNSNWNSQTLQMSYWRLPQIIWVNLTIVI